MASIMNDPVTKGLAELSRKLSTGETVARPSFRLPRSHGEALISRRFHEARLEELKARNEAQPMQISPELASLLQPDS